MYQWIRPEIIVPVHGEMRHMAEHARFARAHGVPHGIVQKNGDLVRLAPDGPEKLGEERVGRLILDGDVILAADGTTMNERRKIASFGGLISVALALERRGPRRRRRRDRARGHSGRGGSRGLPRGGLRRRRRGGAQERRQRGQAARGGPPRRPPLRHRMDRQEAGGRRADRPGLTR